MTTSWILLTWLWLWCRARTFWLCWEIRRQRRRRVYRPRPTLLTPWHASTVHRHHLYTNIHIEHRRLLQLVQNDAARVDWSRQHGGSCANRPPLADSSTTRRL